MNLTSAVSVFIALIAGISAFASARASSKATTSASRLDAETQAYERANAFNQSIIDRQDKEILKLRDDNEKLTTKYNDLLVRIVRIERGLPPELKEALNVRKDDILP